jgi:glucose-6-phosphate isomerase
MGASVQLAATKRPAVKRRVWGDLKAHYKTVRETRLQQLFEDDPQRGERLTVEAVGLYLDYSKKRVNDLTLESKTQVPLSHDTSTNQLISYDRKMNEAA